MEPIDELFYACSQPENEGHPALPRLLYVYCPRAALFFALEGPPRPPSYPERLALLDAAFYGYRGLKRALSHHGFDPAWPAVRRWLAEAAARRRAPGPPPAPADVPLEFPVGPGGVDRVSFRRLGGFEGLARYLWAWAFLLRDWAGLDELPPADFRVVPETVYLQVPGAGAVPLAFPAFRVGDRLGILPSGIDPLLDGLLPQALALRRFDLGGASLPAGGGSPPPELPRPQGPFLPLRGYWGGCGRCAYRDRCLGAGGLRSDQEVFHAKAVS